MRYIAKKDTWFDEGTEAVLIVDLRPEINSGIFSGTRTCQYSEAEMLRPLGEKYEDEEGCSFDEFDVIEEEPK